MSKTVPKDEHLFLYVESELRGEALLTDEQRREVETALQLNPQLCRDAEALKQSFTRMRSMQAPAPPADLASRCLKPSRPSIGERWLSIPVLSVSTVLTAVFVIGLWLGSSTAVPPHTRPTEPFRVLIQQQEYLTDELKAAFEQRYPEPDAPWRAHVEALSQTTRVIMEQYDTNQGDPIVEARLNAVIQNNIRVLGLMLGTVQNDEDPSGARIWQSRTRSI